jgi:hypothetical protein
MHGLNIYLSPTVERGSFTFFFMLFVFADLDALVFGIDSA